MMANADGDADPWIIRRRGDGPDCETMFALADGWLGVRAAAEEAPSATSGSYLAGVFEQTPLQYHERLPGFATSTDTRVPVADGTHFDLLVDGEPAASLAIGDSVSRSLDLRDGTATRQLLLQTGGGQVLKLRVERVMPGDTAATIALRLTIESRDFSGVIDVASLLDVGHRAAPEGADPRIGAELAGGGLALVDHSFGDDVTTVLQRTRRSDRWVSTSQAHRLIGEVRASGRSIHRGSPAEHFSARLQPGSTIVVEKHVGYRWGIGGSADVDHDRLVARLASAGFDRHVETRRNVMSGFWRAADMTVAGDAASERALRFNLFQLFQSAGRDPTVGTAAKGLTGEGYEGHVFWDSEAFLVPALMLFDHALAKTALLSRIHQLEAARSNARAMNHRRGALLPWRTIAGLECSAHYPSGSAQYHINAAVAQAIELYVTASGDMDFLVEGGAELLWETARIWLEVGFYSPRHGGKFCIFGVTGPDEYTALVDNNFYTNKMAALHLNYAARVAMRLQESRPAVYAPLASRLELADAEIEQWLAASAAMYFPRDEQLGVDAQDDSFLNKPRWAHNRDTATPLLLECHPLTLYRHQVSKQADLILAMAFANDGISPARLASNLRYYEAVTTHDSTLSACAFAIVAARAGLPEKALSYFRRAVSVDIDDLHGNLSHGSHMASLAGSVLAVIWGFAGFTWRSGVPGFRPDLPKDWDDVRFSFCWQGRHISVEIGHAATTYSVRSGDPLPLEHHGQLLMISSTPVSVDTHDGTELAA